MSNRHAGSTLVVVVVAVLLALVAIAIIAPRAIMYYYTEEAARENPQLRMVPETLPSSDALTAKPTRISRYGFEINEPWGEPTSKSEVEYFITYTFSAGEYLRIYNPAKKLDTFESIQDIPDARQRDQMRRMYGLESVSSRYDYLLQILRNVPEPVSPFDSLEKLTRVMMWTTQKSLAVPRGSSGIYQFECGDVRGFQMGLPDKSKDLHVHVFLKDDRHLELEVSCPGREGKPLTQSEINFVVQSLRLTPKEKKEESPTKRSATRKPLPKSIYAAPSSVGRG